MFSLQPSLPALLLLGLLLIAIVHQLYLHMAFYGKLIRHKPQPVNNGLAWQPVSVVVCARSEFENLQQLIPAILEQDYPDFELIVVDDASWDGSTSWLEELEKTEKRLKVVFVTDEMKKNYQGKKLALSLGLKAARHELVLLTDADCLPAGNQWIKGMVQAFHLNPETEIVLGYSPFRVAHNPVNLTARMDNAYTGIMYLSHAIAGMPYMGVGRNLSYRRSLFFRNKGFASHLHIAPGDDDLFVNEVCNNSNTAICLDPETFVYTRAKKSFADWFRQKKRHNFAGRYYRREHQFRLGMYAFTHGLLWLSFAASALFTESFGWALALLGLYWLIKWPYILYAFRKLRQRGLAIWMPLYDILYVFYTSAFAFITVFGRQKKW